MKSLFKKIRQYGFWLFFCLGIVPTTLIPLAIFWLNGFLNLELSSKMVFLIFFIYHNLYVIFWVFCLEDGLELKYLADKEIKFKIRKKQLIISAEKVKNLVHKARSGHIPKWLGYSLWLGFLAAAFIPGIFKVGNVYCAVRKNTKEIILWFAILEFRIFVIFFGSHQIWVFSLWFWEKILSFF